MILLIVNNFITTSTNVKRTREAIKNYISNNNKMFNKILKYFVRYL